MRKNTAGIVAFLTFSTASCGDVTPTDENGGSEEPAVIVYSVGGDTGATEGQHEPVERQDPLPLVPEAISVAVPKIGTSIKPVLDVSDPTFPDVALLKPKLAVGTADGDSATVISLITDLEVDRDGRVFVLDFRANHVRVYDTDGILIGTVGRSGAGPGEFSYPGPIAIGEDGYLYVQDAGNRRISIFEVVNGDANLVDEISLPFLPKSFCLLGSRIFVSALFGERAIHEIDYDGSLIRSFGSVQAEVPEGLSDRIAGTVVSFFTGGRLACASESESITLVARNSPVIRTYSADGSLLWRARLGDFSMTRPVAVRNGGVQYQPDPETGGAHTVLNAIVTPEGGLLIQLAFARAGTSTTESEVETRLHSLADGRELDRIEGLPRIGDFYDTSVVGYRNLPYPEFFVLEHDGQ